MTCSPGTRRTSWAWSSIGVDPRLPWKSGHPLWRTEERPAAAAIEYVERASAKASNQLGVPKQHEELVNLSELVPHGRDYMTITHDAEFFQKDAWFPFRERVLLSAVMGTVRKLRLHRWLAARDKGPALLREADMKIAINALQIYVAETC